MKQDPFFKYLAAALIAGVILAFLSPPAAPAQPARAQTITATTPVTASAKS